MGYWILLGLIACTVGMVLVALNTLDTRRPETEPMYPGAPLPDAVAITRRSNLTHADSSAVVWVALVHESVVVPWPLRMARPDGLTDPDIRRLLGLTVRDVDTSLVAYDHGASIGVLSFQVGLDDILAGTSIDEAIDALAMLLARLESFGTMVVIGTIPDLCTTRLAESAGISTSSLSQVTRAWNEALAEIAHAHNADVVDLSSIAGPPMSADIVDEPTRVLHSGFDQGAIAARFAPAIERAVRRLQPIMSYP